MYAVGVIFRDAKAQETKKTSFLNCVAQVRTGLRLQKKVVHTPGSFSRPEFLIKGAEPQTVKQRVSRAVAASLVGAGATPSRCVPKCGQRDSEQTAEDQGCVFLGG